MFRGSKSRGVTRRPLTVCLFCRVPSSRAYYPNLFPNHPLRGTFDFSLLQLAPFVEKINIKAMAKKASGVQGMEVDPKAKGPMPTAPAMRN